MRPFRFIPVGRGGPVVKPVPQVFLGQFNLVGVTLFALLDLVDFFLARQFFYSSSSFFPAFVSVLIPCSEYYQCLWHLPLSSSDFLGFREFPTSLLSKISIALVLAPKSVVRGIDTTPPELYVTIIRIFFING